MLEDRPFADQSLPKVWKSVKELIATLPMGMTVTGQTPFVLIATHRCRMAGGTERPAVSQLVCIGSRGIGYPDKIYILPGD